MASETDLKQFRRSQSSAGSDDSLKLVQQFPRFPEAMHKRFPELAAHEEAQRKWVEKLINALRGGIQGQAAVKPPTP